jgi:osmotically-inducible protein OsmY
VDARDDYTVTAVRDKLTQDPLLCDRKIDVRSDAGVVTLSRAVPDIIARAIASETTFRVDGVRYVKNTLNEKHD